MATKPTFIQDFYRKFYSAYRPIVCSLFNNDSDVAFLRGEIFVAINGTNSFTSTGVLVNSYKNSSNQFTFNLMEYTRPYIGNGLGVVLAWFNFLLPGYFETSKFKISIWPVRYSPSAIGLLYDDIINSVESQDFIATDTITNEAESTDTGDTFAFIDKYVLDSNFTSGGTDTCKPLTNMPYVESNGIVPSFPGVDFSMKHPSGYGVSVDMSDNMTPCIYYLNGRNGYNSLVYFTRNGVTGNISAGGWVQIGYGTNTRINMHKIPVHPLQFEQFILNHTGASGNNIVDANGNLIASEVYILMMSGGLFNTVNSWGGFDCNGNQKSRWSKIAYTDRANNKGVSGCGNNNSSGSSLQRTRFHFKNSLGGYDFFNSYGTEKKSINVKSTVYEKYNSHAIRGERGMKDLWVSRRDEFSVITQPVDNQTAMWLEELLSSPMVWIEKTILDTSTNRNQLIAVQIVPGSYEIFNTDNNINYLEFKYTLANPRTQQRG